MFQLATQLNEPEESALAFERYAQFYMTNAHQYIESKNAALSGLKLSKSSSKFENLTDTLKVWLALAQSKIIENNFIGAVVLAQTDKNYLFNLINWRNNRKPLPDYDQNIFKKITCKLI